MTIGKVNHAGTAKRDWCLLAIAFIAISASTLAWVVDNQAPPSWDPADHLRFGYEYYRQLARFDLELFFEKLFIDKHYYPPFYHLLIAAFFLVAKPGILTAILVNLLLLAVLMASIYRLGRRLYSAEAGLVAAIILPTYHVNAALLHESFVDFALLSLVGLSLFLLFETEQFGRRGASLLLGVTLGFGMLCKQPYAFFLSLPVAYTIAAAARKRQTERLKNASLALLIALSLTAAWYVPHFADIQKIYQINRTGAIAENEPPLFSYGSNIGYINSLASQQLQLPFFVLFLIGMAASLLWYRRESLPLYLCIAGGLTAFTFIANKDVRYTLPFLPAVALLSTCWIGRVSAPWLRVAIMAFLVTLGAASFVDAQWPTDGEGIYLETTNFRLRVWGKNYFHFDRRPSSNDWSFPVILKAIGEQSGRQRGTIRIGMAPNLVHFNPSAFALHSELFWNNRGEHPYILTKWVSDTSSWRQVKRCHYVIVRERIDMDPNADKFESRFTEWIRSNPDRFIQVGRVQVTALNTHVLIYEQVLKRRDRYSPVGGRWSVAGGR